MSLLQRNFLIRRRVDLWLLFFAALLMPLRLPFGSLLLSVYGAIGLYLVCRPYRINRLYSGRFLLLITAYMLWSLALMIWRGELSFTNRQISYVLLLWIFAFAGPGMALIREPVKVYSLGSRIGVLLCAVAVAFQGYLTGGRIGIGGNPAVFAYAAAIAALAATLPVRHPPRLLPNGPWYLLIGTVIIIASETRALMVPLALLACVETMIYIKRLTHTRTKIVAGLISVGILALVMTTGPVASVVSQRFAGMVYYYETGDSSRWSDKASADIRKEMWRGATSVILAHPVVGVGVEAKMPAVQAELGDQAALLDGFLHVHNALLDEWLVNGGIGLILLIAAAGSGFYYLWLSNSDPAMRRMLIYFILLWGSYAMLHNPLLHETSIAVTMLFYSAVYAQGNRNILRSHSGLRSNS